MRTLAVSALVCGALAGAAGGQGPPVRLEFRCVPQIGTPGTMAGPPGVVDVVPTPANIVLMVEEVQRFELQYRVLDLNPADTIVPAGISAAWINITSGNPPVGSYAPALLSRFERQTNTPLELPGPVDTSGPPTPAGSIISMSVGLHRPLREGTTKHGFVPNGSIVSNGITGILPLAIAAPNQGNVNIGADNTAWYGLYSFNFTAAARGATTFSVMAMPDVNTGNTFGYFNDGVVVPLNSPNSVPCSQRITVIPAPGALAILCAWGVTVFRRRRV
jgi:hypothetical protein